MSQAGENCVHCGSRVPADAPHPGFCCRGCQAVHALLVGEGLTRYYDLQTQRVPIAQPTHAHSFAWLEPLVDAAERRAPSLATLDVDVQGIHCAGCVWLIEELFRRSTRTGSAIINPALGKLRLSWAPGALDVRGFLERVERFGYRFGTGKKQTERASTELPLKLGICAALTVNVMLFSFSFYTGLAPTDGTVYRLFSQLVVALSGLVVLVGGSVFFRAAWRGLREGMLHLDLPIAVGVALAFVASLLHGNHAYLDTLDVFVTLMLVGRWLQERVLERNRRMLLEEDGAAGLTVRRLAGDRLETLDAARVRAGDLLLIAPGDLLPVDGELVDAGASVATDWITGEPEVRGALAGETLPAGASNAGRTAFRIVAATSFAESPLPRLLESGHGARGSAHARWWDRLARIYVLTVLSLAALAVALWWPRDHARALDVTVALLVVTCPCALGLAGPLAYQLTLARLRRRGLFVRSGDLLDKLVRVRKVLFDKTGTLTLGRIELASPTQSLSPALRDAAYDTASRSSHPVSRAIAEALARDGARLDANANVVEEPGCGLRLERDGRQFRLGRPSWAAPGVTVHADHTLLAVDGEPVFAFVTRESLRLDARRDLERLRQAGCQVWLLSGDAPARVAEVARSLGIAADHARGGLRPDDKARLVAALDAEDTLYLGDGVNDSLAFEEALVAGTPALDRPVLPGKSDFVLAGDDIGALVDALALARRLRAVVRRNLVVSLVYNIVAIAACFAGVMTPLAAAVFMPVTSLSIVAATATSLSERRARRAAGELAWTS